MLGNFGLVGWGLLGPRVPLGPRGVLDLVADRDAFDASYSGAGVSLTYGDSWDPSKNHLAHKYILLFIQSIFADLLKFRFSKKATKFETISDMI